MVLETLALLSGVKGLFMYNRQSYSFNKTLDQERLYHLQKMRLEQLKLYRDDIRDLFELVVGKMDNYYLVNTLALGFSLAFYYEGKVPVEIPSWLFWLWAMSLGTAIVSLFLSVWFAVHASVVAQMFSTRILTQWLRLPVPGVEQIDAGAPRLEEFEKSSVREQLRVPIVGSSSRTNSQRTGPLDPPTTMDPLIQEGYNYYLGHFYMFKRLQKHWMSLDAYCRVCMVIGCNQILNAVTYTGLSYFSLYDSQWGTVAFVIVPVVFACIHCYINLLLTKKEAIIFLTIHSLGPLLAGIAAGFQMVYTIDGRGDFGAKLAQAIAIASYVCHLLSSFFFVFLGLELQHGLPTRFTSVNYIDVLGMQQDKDEAPPAPLETSQLKRTLSAKISDIFSVAASNVSAEKAQPPIDQVVPPAESMRKADRMYQSLVVKKVGLVRSASVPTIAEGQPVFATQLPVSKGPTKRLNTFLEAAGTASVRTIARSGPKDYQPTPAQLHSPDVLAKMPRVAFRVVGITIMFLWIAGILFSSMALGGVNIGWDNTIALSTLNSTVNALGAHAKHEANADVPNGASPLRFVRPD
jgi:hypothetical protein